MVKCITERMGKFSVLTGCDDGVTTLLAVPTDGQQLSNGQLFNLSKETVCFRNVVLLRTRDDGQSRPGDTVSQYKARRVCVRSRTTSANHMLPLRPPGYTSPPHVGQINIIHSTTNASGRAGLIALG